MKKRSLDELDSTNNGTEEYENYCALVVSGFEEIEGYVDQLNDYDIASVLIGVLRDRNIPARYAKGTIEITAEQAMEWTATDDINVAMYEGIKAANILPEYKEIIIHDCWESYWKFSDVTHGVCCAHLLREPNGVEENHPEQTWATEFKKLLLKMKKAKEKAIAHGKSSLSKSSIWVYKKRYDEILQTAYKENPLPQTEKVKRGKPKRGKVLSLIDRLRKYKGAVCLSLENLSVPFDNNQAERDIRNIKVKTKVSGCFRSVEGATEYLTLMSYIGTARKQMLFHHTYSFIRLFYPVFRKYLR